MLSKEQFLHFTSQLEEIHKSSEEKSKALQVLTPECQVFYDISKETSLILELLTELFPSSKWAGEGVYSSDIEWFYYDRVVFPFSEEPLSATVGDKEFLIKTWEDLYELLTAQENEKD